MWRELLMELGVRVDRITKTIEEARLAYQHAKVKALAEETVKCAERYDLVVTIERKHIAPLAMRHHVPVIEVRGRLIRPGEPGFPE